MENVSTVPETRRASRVESYSRRRRGFEGFIGASPAMERLYRMLATAGPSTASVLLVGESGTGKELAAQTLHKLSNRSRGPFVAVNCAAIPETLIEGELFGHEKGAFTGATRRQQGCFELAHQGTLFLDELSAMPLSSQVKLLRALEEKSFRRLRGSDELRVDVRILAATNQCPEAAVREGKLREDLLYRINVFTLALPPLRERPSDILLLAQHFIEQFAPANGKDVLRLDPEAENLLNLYSWPGNVRELRNAMERAVILANGPVIRPEDLPVSVKAYRGSDSVALEPSMRADRAEASAGTVRAPSVAEEPVPATRDRNEPFLQVGMTVEEATRALMLRTLEATSFNKTRTAQILGVSAKTVYNKLKEWSAEGDPEAQRADVLSRGRMRETGPRNGNGTARLVSIDAARKRRFA